MAALLAISLACAGADDTATSAAPPQPDPAMAPTVAPAPVATLIPGAPTAISVLPTPTRVLPTVTPVVTGQPVYGGVMRMAAAMDNKTLDPHLDGGTFGRPVTYAIYNTIVGYDPDFNIVPELAESWEFSADGKRVIFHVVKGAKFHDGTPVDAAAIKWSLDRVMDPDGGFPYRSLLEPFIESVDVVDEDTFAINVFAPFRPLLATLGDRPGFIVPKSAAPLKAEGALGSLVSSGFSAKPIGSGAFKLKEWFPGSHILLERNDDYWEDGKPYLDGIRYQEVGEASSRFAMLRTGETDLMEVRADDLPVVEDNPNIKIVPHESGRWTGHFLAVDVPPWDNKPLRQAFAYAIDREAYISTILGGAGRLAYTSEGIGWAYNPDIKIYDFDLVKAREKMIEAGLPNGITIDFTCSSSASSIQACEVYQAMAAQVGIDLNIVAVPGGDITRLQLERAATNRVTSWRPRADPHGRLFLLFHTDGGRQPTHGYSNAEVDRLLNEAATLYDTVRAKQLYDQAQTIITDDAGVIFVAYTTNYAGLSKRVQNFAWIPDFQWRLRDLWLD